MAARLRSALFAALLTTILVSFGRAVPAEAASPEGLDAKLKALQEQVAALKRGLEKPRRAPPVAAPRVPAPPAGPPSPAPAPATAEQPQPPPAAKTPWITD